VLPCTCVSRSKLVHLCKTSSLLPLALNTLNLCIFFMVLPFLYFFRVRISQWGFIQIIPHLHTMYFAESHPLLFFLIVHSPLFNLHFHEFLFYFQICILCNSLIFIHYHPLLPVVSPALKQFPFYIDVILFYRSRFYM
jgi:uncharacterized membrane protein